MNSPVSVNQGQSNLPLRGVAPPDTPQKHTPRKGHSMKALVKVRPEKGLWIQDIPVPEIQDGFEQMLSGSGGKVVLDWTS